MEEKLLTEEEDKAENALQQLKKSRFPKAARLLHSKQFHKIIREGRRFSGESVSIQYFTKSSVHSPRLGITVSKKFGKAHDRNRFKRIVREAFREVISDLPMGVQIHVLPKIRSHTLCKHDILKDITNLFLKT